MEHAHLQHEMFGQGFFWCDSSTAVSERVAGVADRR